MRSTEQIYLKDQKRSNNKITALTSRIENQPNDRVTCDYFDGKQYNTKMREVVYQCQSVGVSSRSTASVISNVMQTLTGKYINQVGFLKVEITPQVFLAKLIIENYCNLIQMQ